MGDAILLESLGQFCQAGIVVFSRIYHIKAEERKLEEEMPLLTPSLKRRTRPSNLWPFGIKIFRKCNVGNYCVYVYFTFWIFD